MNERFTFGKDRHPLPDATLLEKDVRFKPARKAKAARAPDITVATVVFNAIKGRDDSALRGCLESVQSQTGVELEHLIVDGASTDGSLGFVMDFKNENHDIRLLSKPDKGIYEAMNRAVALARGKYIIFLNSDDFFHNPDGMSASLRRLVETGADFSYAPVRVINEANDELTEHIHANPSPQFFFFSMPFSHQSVLTKTSCIRAVNGFDNVTFRSSADYDLMLRLVFAGCVGCFVPCRFATFRTGGFSSQNAEIGQKECGVAYSRLYSSVCGTPVTPADGYYIYTKHFLPRHLKLAFIDSYLTSLERFAPSYAFSAESTPNPDVVNVPLRTATSKEDGWVGEVEPLWSDEALMARFAKTEPKAEVLATDFCNCYDVCLHSISPAAWTWGSLGLIFRAPHDCSVRSTRLRCWLTAPARQNMLHQRMGIAVNGKLFASFPLKRKTLSECVFELPAGTFDEDVAAIEIHSEDPGMHREPFSDLIKNKPCFRFHGLRVEIPDGGAK